jgi:hypothetical protein
MKEDPKKEINADDDLFFLMLDFLLEDRHYGYYFIHGGDYPVGQIISKEDFEKLGPDRVIKWARIDYTTICMSKFRRS